MNKVFVLSPSEDWIVDRFVSEWYEDNSDITVKNPLDADVIWLFADWCYRHINRSILLKKKVITTIHHIVEKKFNLDEFKDRDTITTVYHVPNDHTKKFIEKFTNKQIFVIPYWANQKIWKVTETKQRLRKKYNLPETSYLIGSFQRDTEGNDLISPKLEKGPDILAAAIEKWSKEKQNLHVVLAGWRRQYIINRLSFANIPFSYFERPKQQTINELYQTLDLYPVTARCEGGPQSLIECGLLNVPVVSRDVGIASQVLPPSSISDDVTLAIANIPNVEEWKLPQGYNPYKKLIQSL